jgi:predicted O-linked N-acetylglucosamine transferase (SPINDLY family)
MRPLPEAFHHQMHAGTQLHQQNQPEQALVAFEKALQLAPGNTEAASACATLLMQLQRPQAAHSMLYAVYADLMQSADGATNWAIVCEANGQTDQAKTAYAQALAIDPHHLRALNNAALLAASAEDWDTAARYLTQCVALAPDEPAWAVNLCDVLTGAHQHAQALQVITQAVQQWPTRADVAVRQAVLLAYNAQFSAAHAAFDVLDSDAQQLLGSYLASAEATSSRAVGKTLKALPDCEELFTVAAFSALQDCYWGHHSALVTTLRQFISASYHHTEHKDWRDLQFYALMLPLTEEEQSQSLRVTTRGYPAARQAVSQTLRPPHPDGRIHVGICTANLHEPRVRNALAHQLSLHDPSRFALHVYSNTPQPVASLTQDMAGFAQSVVEIAHLPSADMAKRLRLDMLDIYIDAAYYTPWCRADIPYLKVAPIHIRQQSWQRWSSGVYQYIMGDHFTHPDGFDKPGFGPTARLPHTCWIATTNDTPAHNRISRKDALLPESALVLCSFLGTVAVDPDTFAMWMQILRNLPDAVLWLPAYGPSAQANLRREAQLAGVATQRLVFSTRAGRAEQLERMQLADLFVDSLRFNANNGLADALRMGVPALSCAGHNMASRLGGSIIRAAGLPDCVLDSPQDLVQRAVALGQSPSALQALRTQLATAQTSAPLFQPAQRIREWESAWTTMVQRHRAGLPPASFDVV